MNRHLAISCAGLVTLAGCNVPVSGILGPESTPLVAGLYQGEYICVSDVKLAGLDSVTESTSGEEPLLISDSGFPVHEGVESRVGETIDLEVGGVSLRATVQSITNSGSSVVVTGNMIAELTESDTLTGEYRETYVQAGATIVHTHQVLLGQELAGIGTDIIRLGCDTTYMLTAGNAINDGAQSFLTRDDVQGLPPGDAVGDDLTGVYRLGAIFVEDCQCIDTLSDVEDSVCQFVRGNSLAVVDVEQLDGMLTSTTRDGRQWLEWGDRPSDDFGGTGNTPGFGEAHAYANGTFAVGGVVPLYDNRTNQISGEGVSLWAGVWDARGMFGTYRIHLRGNLSTDRGPQQLDCEQLIAMDLIRVE